MTEYTFDVKLYAVSRVTADDQASARKKLAEVVDCLDISFDKDGVKLTEASAWGVYELMEIDGKDVWDSPPTVKEKGKDNG